MRFLQINTHEKVIFNGTKVAPKAFLKWKILFCSHFNLTQCFKRFFYCTQLVRHVCPYFSKTNGINLKNEDLQSIFYKRIALTFRQRI